MLVGSIEAGGTKFICALGDENYQIKDKAYFPTTTPEETLGKVADYFSQFAVEAIGIGSFGPLNLDPHSPKYGYITSTTKPYWQNTNFVGYLKQGLHVPIYWTTDVNSSAYGEYVVSKRKQLPVDSLVYYTVGTGVGAGAIINGQFVGTIGNPEMGHTLVKRHPQDRDFTGNCPYHQDCLEGLIAGPTFLARTGKKGENVPLSDPVWQIIAYYLAQAVMQATLILRPNKIILGGGVISEELLSKVRAEFAPMLADYVEVPDLADYISMPAIEHNGSAIIGGFALAEQALWSNQK
ncbi:ROK family protein [Lactobacillus sp. ESL0681]|uniref:ROK family protein n=1 Tax=Lactobacillus sp. ESL0681 TaxID=2983211 RepID=UPI0023F85088|nr:ROK family protein [Lactobacillus sp. ESL0681]WEV39866.1 ROK family protein [Lactobacillus sp. ESL0681]